MPKITQRQRAFQTPWFSIVKKNVAGLGDSRPYYSIKTSDYVSVIALTAKNEIILVRQYRPALERVTLEFPCGHVEKKESSVATARRELLEETGYRAKRIKFLGCLFPDSGRMTNRMWCYLAYDVYPDPQVQTEAGIKPYKVKLVDFFKLVKTGAFNQALNLGHLGLAISKKYLSLFL